MNRAITIAALLGVAWGCGQPNAYQPPPPPTVTVARPIRQTVTNFIEETGTTEPVEMVEIRARVRGYLDEILFDAGSDVKKGQPLYRIQPEEYDAKVAAAEAQVELDKVELTRAELELARQERLAAQNATAGAQVDEAKAARDGADAAVKASQAALQLAELDRLYTEINSPITGRVDRSLVKAGNLVGGLDATRLTTVVSYDPIYVNFNISERELLRLLDSAPRDEHGKIEQNAIPLQLQRANDAEFAFDGFVESADLGVDQTTGTFRIRGQFANPERKILPGLFVRVRIPTGVQENAVLIPELAIAADQAGRFALIVVDGEEGKIVERRNVAVGAQFGEYVVVEEGLAGDEWVVVNGLQRARPGAPVAAEETTLSAPEMELVEIEARESDSAVEEAESPTTDDAPTGVESESAAPDAEE